jgi:hypothetical protein
MYVDLNESYPETFFQGDIIKDFPFFIYDSAKALEKVSETNFSLQDETDTIASPSLFVVETRRTKVLLLSQTCDIQRRKHIMACPIYEVDSLLEDGTLNTKRVEALRKRQINYWFYLPEQGDEKESLADLQTIFYVPKRMLDQHLSSRIISLDDWARHHLCWTLATYFGRPIESKE